MSSAGQEVAVTVVSTPPVIIEHDWNGAVISIKAMATISAERTPVLLESAARMDSISFFVRLSTVLAVRAELVTPGAVPV